MKLDSVRASFDRVGDRGGWDFSKIQSRRGEIPWDYRAVVQSETPPAARALDIGTGGGEYLLEMAAFFSSVVGIDPDPEMIAVATSNAQKSGIANVSFQKGSADELPFSGNTLDFAMNRQAPFNLQEIARVLRPGGVFVTQQVGIRNLENIVAPFGGQAFPENAIPSTARRTALQVGLVVDRLDEYDTEYRYLNLDSLVFQLKAISHYLLHPVSGDSGMTKLLEAARVSSDGRGQFISNEHRWLMVAHK
ncbi:MAG: class I SAM-dependent methyltransferase [Dehalococcoidia bacterium]|nr:class I SAM-dependent methyltransferase [Dehalococcoidia bacterium]